MKTYKAEAIHDKAELASIQSYLNKLGFGTLGLKVPSDLDTHIDKWGDVQKFTINPEQTGPLQVIYTSITGEAVFAKLSTGGILVKLDFKWKHPSGSNGYGVRIEFDSKGKYIKTMN